MVKKTAAVVRAGDRYWIWGLDAGLDSGNGGGAGGEPAGSVTC